VGRRRFLHRIPRRRGAGPHFPRRVPGDTKVRNSLREIAKPFEKKRSSALKTRR
jgi:hypothetical protein